MRKQEKTFPKFMRNDSRIIFFFEYGRGVIVCNRHYDAKMDVGYYVQYHDMKSYEDIDIDILEIFDNSKDLKENKIIEDNAKDMEIRRLNAKLAIYELLEPDFNKVLELIK